MPLIQKNYNYIKNLGVSNVRPKMTEAEIMFENMLYAGDGSVAKMMKSGKDMGPIGSGIGKHIPIERDRTRPQIYCASSK